MTLLYFSLGFGAGFFVALLVVFLSRSASCPEMDKILNSESEDETDILIEIDTAFNNGSKS
jgi:hypothetical protein